MKNKNCSSRTFHCYCDIKTNFIFIPHSQTFEITSHLLGCLYTLKQTWPMCLTLSLPGMAYELRLILQPSRSVGRITW